jgi:predicted nucleotidyltransferase
LGGNDERTSDKTRDHAPIKKTITLPAGEIWSPTNRNLWFVCKRQSDKKSDVDILIQLMKPLGLEFVELAYHLEKVLKKKVDLATFNTLKRSLENPRYKHIASDIDRTLSYV